MFIFSAIDINYMPVKGELVACRYNKDSNYYRAVIESFDKEEILISFIDFGNREIVSMKDIKGLSEDLKKVCLTNQFISMFTFVYAFLCKFKFL